MKDLRISWHTITAIAKEHTAKNAPVMPRKASPESKNSLRCLHPNASNTAHIDTARKRKPLSLSLFFNPVTIILPHFPAKTIPGGGKLSKEPLI